MAFSKGAIEVIALSCTFLPVAFLAIVLRLVSRQMMKIKLCFNDCAAIMAMVFTIGVNIIFLTSAIAGGMGVHVKDATPNQLAIHQKLFIPAQLFRGAANSCVKVSIVDLYIGIFPNPKFRKLCYFTIALSVCYFVTLLLVTVLLCRPIVFNWDNTVPGASCGTMNLAHFIVAITNLLIDAFVVILPMPMLWGLQLPLKKRIGLAAMFGLGSIICTISLQRVIWLHNWDHVDFTYTDTLGSCWGLLEPTLGVINACLPTIRPVLRKVFNKDPLLIDGGKGSANFTHDFNQNDSYHLSNLPYPLIHSHIASSLEGDSEDCIESLNPCNGGY